MEWGFLILLLIATPVILFPVALGWYLNIGQIIAAVTEPVVKRFSQHHRMVRRGLNRVSVVFPQLAKAGHHRAGVRRNIFLRGKPSFIFFNCSIVLQYLLEG
jgi:hypothetical protein